MLHTAHVNIYCPNGASTYTDNGIVLFVLSWSMNYDRGMWDYDAAGVFAVLKCFPVSESLDARSK